MNNSLFFEHAYRATISDEDFRKLAALIEKESGIKMPAEKKVMLQNRLKKRLFQLGMTDFHTYTNYVFDKNKGAHEVLYLLNFISTNKTDFFREPAHYSFLEKELIPHLTAHNKHLKLWSAGCSSGEEAYSLAILLEEARRNISYDFTIEGTDISVPVLQKAAKAVYPERSVEEIPLQLRKRYFLRNKDASKAMVRVVPQLRKKVIFKYLNFMEDAYSMPSDFDIIFFRNVLIYFNSTLRL